MHSVNIVYEDIGKLEEGGAGISGYFEVCRPDRFPVPGWI